MEIVLKLLSRFVKHSKPHVTDNWVTLVFPRLYDAPPKLGRWRNVSKGCFEGDVHDPAYWQPHLKYHSQTKTSRSALAKENAD